MEPTPPKGCRVTETIGGERFIQIHYTADPEKRSDAWRLDASRGVPLLQWQREMELSREVFDGVPVYTDYLDAKHCPSQLRGKMLVVSPNARLYGGWDCGSTLTPAFVLCQVVQGQLQVLMEVISKGGEPMERFAPRVLRAIERYPSMGGRWADVFHVGDYTVGQRSGPTGETSLKVAQKYGVTIKPISNQWQGRWSAVTWFLVDDIDERTPRFVLSDSCKLVRTGFLGGYKFQENLDKPLKNKYSNPHDALQYVAVHTRSMLDPSRTGTSRGRYI